MNLEEAYNLLECLEDVSDEDLKVKHKELVFRYHPDRYKEDPDKLSKINSAFQMIKDAREHPEKYQQQMPGGFGIDLGDIFSNFAGQSFNHSSPPPLVSINLTFKESIIGTIKEIKYTRKAKCVKCEGKGTKILGNDCTKCNGRGRVMQQSPGMLFSSTCDKCYGRNMKTNKCVPCNAKGVIDQDISTQISTPQGVVDNSHLVLQHAGNFQGAQIFGESYGNVNINIRVEADPDLTLVSDDVVSNLEISLLEALSGCKKQVRTIYDEREIDIKSQSKNLEEVRLENCGIPNKNGVQRVVLKVKYPDDINGLVRYLKEGEIK